MKASTVSTNGAASGPVISPDRALRAIAVFEPACDLEGDTATLVEFERAQSDLHKQEILAATAGLLQLVQRRVGAEEAVVAQKQLAVHQFFEGWSVFHVALEHSYPEHISALLESLTKRCLESCEREASSLTEHQHELAQYQAAAAHLQALLEDLTAEFYEPST
jgi:hypothetical protein